jgi:hypothetical protein
MQAISQLLTKNSPQGANLNRGTPLVWVTKQMGIQTGVIQEWPRGFGDIRVTSGD